MLLSSCARFFVSTSQLLQMDLGFKVLNLHIYSHIDLQLLSTIDTVAL